MIHITDGCQKYVCVVDGHPLTKDHYKLSVKYPTKVLIWSCFCYQGTGALQVIEETINSDIYIDILNQHVVGQMTNWFPDNLGVFQQDRAPCHVSKRTLEFIENQQINLLP